MARKQRPHLLCIDRIIPLEIKHHAAALAIKENIGNLPGRPEMPGVSVSPMKMALFTGKRWQNGRTPLRRYIVTPLQQPRGLIPRSIEKRRSLKLITKL